MSFPNSKVLNIDILSITEAELLKNLNEGVLYTPNLDHLVRLQKDKEFYNIYQQAEWIVCDSRVLYFFAKLLKRKIPEAIPGSSFFTSYYNYHKDDESCKIFLLGAAEGVALKAMDEINKTVGRNIVVGAHSPSYGFEKKDAECNEIVDIINKSGATVLLVGVGSPKQEKWIYNYRNELSNIKLFMGLGATIDFEAKTLDRAPKFYQKIGMEWFYRVIKEPRRLFKRYFIDDIQFVYYFFLQLVGLYKNPFDKK